MKILNLLFLLLLAAVANSQIEISVSAGLNKDWVSVTKTRYDLDSYQSGYSWEGNIGVGYSIDDLIIVTGVSVKSKHYTRYFESGADITVRYDYKPVYLGIPFGFGCRVLLENNISLEFLVTVAYNLGIGGKVNEYARHEYPSIYETITDRKIKFGKEQNGFFSNSDFEKHYWSVEPGVQVSYKRIKLGFLYEKGITNTLPQSEADYEYQKLNSLVLLLKYSLFNRNK